RRVGGGRCELNGSVPGKWSQFDGRLHATGTMADLAMGNMAAAGFDVSLDAAIAGTGDRLEVSLVDPGSAVARRVSGGVLAGTVGKVAVPLVQDEGPLIAIDLNGRGAPRASYDLRLGAVTLKAPLLLGGPKPLPVAVTFPGLRWMGTWSAADGHQATVQLADGSLAVPSLDVTARGVRADVAITADKWSVDLGAARIMHSATPPLFAPL